MLKATMEDLIFLPPGFRFHPTDEEVIINYLMKKVLDGRFISIAIAEVDLNKCEPWDLPSKAKIGEKEWYFFYQKDRKYPTGTRTNRATKSGYWKATGKDKEIHKGKGNLIGMKKILVFYKGRAPRGEKTNWVMNEFRLEGRFCNNLRGTEKDEWVVCRVTNKTDGSSVQTITTDPIPSDLENHDIYDIQTLPPLIDVPYPDTTTPNLIFSNNNSTSIDAGGFIEFSPNSVREAENQQNLLQPNRTSFVPISISQTFTPPFIFNNPYTTHESPSYYHPQYDSTTTTSTNPTPISVNKFQYLHQGRSTNGFIDSNQTTQTKGKEEESLDFPFADSTVLQMHRSQSAEDLSHMHLLFFDGLFGDIENISWKF